MELQPKFNTPKAGGLYDPTVPLTPAENARRLAIMSQIPDVQKYNKLHKKLHYDFECLVQNYFPAIYPFIVREHEFSKVRRFRFDYCWIQYKVAVDLQGGIYAKPGKGRKSGHLSIPGMEADMEKINLAQVEGWVMLQLSPRKVRDFPEYVVQSLLSAFRRQGF